MTTTAVPDTSTDHGNAVSPTLPPTTRLMRFIDTLSRLLVAAIALVIVWNSYTAMALFGMDRIHLAENDAKLLAVTIEGALLAAAILAFRNALRGLPYGKLMGATWVLAGGSGVFAAADQFMLGNGFWAAGFRFSVPLIGAGLIHALLNIDKLQASGLDLAKLITRSPREALAHLRTTRRKEDQILRYTRAQDKLFDAMAAASALPDPVSRRDRREHAAAQAQIAKLRRKEERRFVKAVRACESRAEFDTRMAAAIGSDERNDSYRRRRFKLRETPLAPGFDGPQPEPGPGGASYTKSEVEVSALDGAVQPWGGVAGATSATDAEHEGPAPLELANDHTLEPVAEPGPVVPRPTALVPRPEATSSWPRLRPARGVATDDELITASTGEKPTPVSAEVQDVDPGLLVPLPKDASSADRVARAQELSAANLTPKEIAPIVQRSVRQVYRLLEGDATEDTAGEGIPVVRVEPIGEGRDWERATEEPALSTAR